MIRIRRDEVAETIPPEAPGERGCYGRKLGCDKIESKKPNSRKLIEKPWHRCPIQ
jgi:hypothetical protein